MTTTLDRMVRAMQSSPAWPAVFDAGAARTLIVAALKEAREPDEPRAEVMDDAANDALDSIRDVNPIEAAWRAGIDHILGDEG